MPPRSAPNAAKCSNFVDSALRHRASHGTPSVRMRVRDQGRDAKTAYGSRLLRTGRVGANPKIDTMRTG